MIKVKIVSDGKVSRVFNAETNEEILAQGAVVFITPRGVRANIQVDSPIVEVVAEGHLSNAVVPQFGAGNQTAQSSGKV